MTRTALLPTLSLLLSGCGDSLVSGAALDILLGLEPFPEEPMWLTLWVDEGGEGVLASCELAPVPGEIEREDDDTVILDKTWIPPPEWVEPVAWTEGEEFAWALGLMVLVDGARFDFDQAAVALEEQEPELLPGVWGMADANALLLGEGDIEALGGAVVAGSAPPELDEDGRAWVGFAQEIVVATGSFAGAVTALDLDDQDDLSEFGLPVRRLDTLDDTSLQLLFGVPFGGVGVDGECEDPLDWRRRGARRALARNPKKPAPDAPRPAFPSPVLRNHP